MGVPGSGRDAACSVSRRAHLVRLAGVFAGVLLLHACASSSRGLRDGPRENPDIITRAEISRTHSLTAYDAVRLLRPTFLRSRGQTSLMRQSTDEPVVYLDDRRMGGLTALRDIPVQLIFQIRYLSSSEAQLKWGSGHPGGVVQVVSATSRPGT